MDECNCKCCQIRGKQILALSLSVKSKTEQLEMARGLLKDWISLDDEHATMEDEISHGENVFESTVKFLQEVEK